MQIAFYGIGKIPTVPSRRRRTFSRSGHWRELRRHGQQGVRSRNTGCDRRNAGLLGAVRRLFAQVTSKNAFPADGGSFVPAFHHVNLEIHPVFLRFSWLNLEQNSSPSTQKSVFRGSRLSESPRKGTFQRGDGEGKLLFSFPVKAAACGRRASCGCLGCGLPRRPL